MLSQMERMRQRQHISCPSRKTTTIVAHSPTKNISLSPTLSPRSHCIHMPQHAEPKKHFAVSNDHWRMSMLCDAGNLQGNGSLTSKPSCGTRCTKEEQH